MNGHTSLEDIIQCCFLCQVVLSKVLDPYTEMKGEFSNDFALGLGTVFSVNTVQQRFESCQCMPRVPQSESDEMGSTPGFSDATITFSFTQWKQSENAMNPIFLLLLLLSLCGNEALQNDEKDEIWRKLF